MSVPGPVRPPSCEVACQCVHHGRRQRSSIYQAGETDEALLQLISIPNGLTLLEGGDIKSRFALMFEDELDKHGIDILKRDFKKTKLAQIVTPSASCHLL